MKNKRAAVVFALTLLVGTVANAQILNVRDELENRLSRFGKFTVLGRWDGQACELTGIAPRQYPIVINEQGNLLNGILIGKPATVLAVGALANDTKTFQNCNSVGSTAQANFSENVTETMSLAITNGFSTTASGTLNATAGAPGEGSAAIGISGSKTWSASTTSTQSTSISVQMGNNYSTTVPAGEELDISYVVMSKRISMPISATGVFDARLYPCQSFPAGHRMASDFLSSTERTFTATGVIEFDDAQEGVFKVSSPRPTTCTQPGLRLMTQRHAAQTWTQRRQKYATMDVH